MSDSYKLQIVNNKINFSCLSSKCPHHCCGAFDGISECLATMDGRKFEEITLTDEDFNSIVGGGFGKYIESAVSPLNGKIYHRMILNDDGSCTAMQNGRCVIHDFSPAICRAYPFYIDMFGGLCAIECPGFNGKQWRDVSQFSRYFDAAMEIYSYWVKFYSKDETDA